MNVKAREFNHAPAGRLRPVPPTDFLRHLYCRCDKQGWPLTDQFMPAEMVGEGQWRFPLVLAATEMPDLWRFVDMADTCTLFHGIPATAIDCLLYHRVLFESNAGDDSERTQRGTSGVYCFLSRLQPKLLWYAKWNCLADTDIAYATYV